MLEDYPVGRKVRVYYDPKNPNEAVLEPGSDWAGYIPVALGSLFTIIGILGVFGVIKANEHYAQSKEI